MHICRKRLHCTTLTGRTPDGRCLQCRRDSHRRAQAAYQRTTKGDATTGRYDRTAKNELRKARNNAKARV